MRLELDQVGDFLIQEMEPVCVDTLFRLPSFLESDDPKVRERLLPATYTDPEEEAGWRRHSTPELEYLFASNVEIVREDLKSIEVDGVDLYKFTIPSKHKTAWLSALNAGRLAIFVVNDMVAGDMEIDIGQAGDRVKDLALLRIHILAFLQESLLSGGQPPFDDESDEGLG